MSNLTNKSTKKRIYSAVVFLSSNPKKIGRRKRIQHKVFRSEYLGLRMTA